MTTTALQAYADELVKEFEFTDAQIRDCVKYFIAQSEENLQKDEDRGLPMIPTFVTQIPNGTERGTYLAVDLGGTNLRVCSVTLNGDSTFDLIQEKAPVPPALMKGKSREFFGFMADRVGDFLNKHHNDNFVQEDEEKGLKTPGLYKLGFTFSFPVVQTALNRGCLLRWTKGFDIHDCVGQDVCVQFQQALNERGLPVYVAALVNDTVGTLMARSYTKPSDGRTLCGCIFGTGTNGAYSEKISHIGKFDKSKHPDIDSKIMVINTEWGSFDNDLKHIPNTRFDALLDQNTPNKGYHMFEKRISGMFLGEILRLVLVEMAEKGLLFTNASKDDADNSSLNIAFSADTSVSAGIDADDSEGLTTTEKIIKSTFGKETSLDERKAIQKIVKAIGRRSARLSAVPLAGLILRTKALEKFEGPIDIGADGSVVEFYPNFEKMLREALRATDIGEQTSRITMGIAKDGSGVGAALCALSAE